MTNAPDKKDGTDYKEVAVTVAKEAAGMAAKLFKDVAKTVKQSVGEIVTDYKARHPKEDASAGTQTKPQEPVKKEEDSK